jgi:hypothetical protein
MESVCRTIPGVPYQVAVILGNYAELIEEYADRDLDTPREDKSPLPPFKKGGFKNQQAQVPLF